MVKLTKIYTRGGDGGETSLVSGERRPKYDLRVAAYGTVDETNSTIGLVRQHTAGHEIDDMLARIQNDLFDLGADLACPDHPQPQWTPLRVTDQQVLRLELEIDQLNDGLAPLTSFVLPGGTPAAAWLHLARTVCRRAERMAVKLAAQEKVNQAAIRYLNRLSDFLFVASRYLNDKENKNILWTPGANR